MAKPGIPKGTRDLTPTLVRRQYFIIDTIRELFEMYGFEPIETPAMENLDTLTGKYGEEGDALLFKILNNGDFLAKADRQALASGDSVRMVPSIAKRGLRYDLTVPFARYVVMHQHELKFPFRRYQIQPVWRADRPQKGRFQEFYQCDADIIGTSSLLCEGELLALIHQVFQRLDLHVEIRINHRAILKGIAEVTGIGEQLSAMTVIMDKLDKVGWKGVEAEMLGAGFSGSQVAELQHMLQHTDLTNWASLLAASSEGSRGVSELTQIMTYAELLEASTNVVFDASLARGLNYYTGCIIEVRSLEVPMGSILGGGRYDNLTGVFGLPAMSGIGVSFGVSRILDLMTELDRFPAKQLSGSKVLILAMSEQHVPVALSLLQAIRSAGCSAQLFPEYAKLKRQMKYANDVGVPYVAMIGEEEISRDLVLLKDMVSGDQWHLTQQELISRLSADD